MSERNSLAIKPQEKQAVTQFNFFDPAQFETMQRVCKMFASSELVPDIYKITKDNPEPKAIANCMIAIEVATRIGASPLMIMQNMVPIYGRPAWSSKFLIASVNSCGRFNPIQYKFTNLGKVGDIKYTEYVWDPSKNKKVATEKTFPGKDLDNIQCVAYSTAKGDDKLLESTPIDIKLAIVEGWYTKLGSKWKTMPMQMLTYRAASFWTNAYSPEISMGMKTIEEVIDIVDVDYEDMTASSNKSKEIISKSANKTAMSMEIEEAKTVESEKPKTEPVQTTMEMIPDQPAKPDF